MANAILRLILFRFKDIPAGTTFRVIDGGHAEFLKINDDEALNSSIRPVVFDQTFIIFPFKKDITNDIYKEKTYTKLGGDNFHSTEFGYDSENTLHKFSRDCLVIKVQ